MCMELFFYLLRPSAGRSAGVAAVFGKDSRLCLGARHALARQAVCAVVLLMGADSLFRIL